MVTVTLKTAAFGLQAQERRLAETAQSIIELTAQQTSAADPVRAERGSSDGAALAVQLDAQEAAVGSGFAQGGDASLARSIADLITGEAAYRANVAVVVTAEDIAKETIDLVG